MALSIGLKSGIKPLYAFPIRDSAGNRSEIAYMVLGQSQVKRMERTRKAGSQYIDGRGLRGFFDLLFQLDRRVKLLPVDAVSGALAHQKNDQRLAISVFE
jgi:hypothetical protein